MLLALASLHKVAPIDFSLTTMVTEKTCNCETSSPPYMNVASVETLFAAYLYYSHTKLISSLFHRLLARCTSIRLYIPTLNPVFLLLFIF